MAVFSTVLFTIQTTITLLFSGADGDVESVDSDSPFLTMGSFFTFRNIVNFLTVFSWTNIICTENGLEKLPTIIISVSSGLFMVFLMLITFYLITKMKEDGSTKIENSIGSIGVVYLTTGKIPGKITVEVQNTMREYDAISDNTIKTGELVRVVEVVNGDTVKVETI